MRLRHPALIMGATMAALSALAAQPVLAQPVSAQPVSPQAGAVAYVAVGAIPLGAPDRWDYVVFDADARRVYVAHADRVSVVDPSKGVKIGDVTGIAGGTHGVAISTATGRGYTDDGKAGLVDVFDLKTLKLVKTLKASVDADAIARDPKTGHVFVVAGDSQNLTVVDPATNTVAKVIPVGDKMGYAVADGAGKLYVNGTDKREIVRIDTATNLVDARWPVPDCESPHGLAMDVASRRLFSSCVNAKMMVVNADGGHVVAELPIGLGTDAAAFDPSHRRAFSSNGRDGTLTVIQEDGPDTYRVMATVPTAKSGRTMAVDPATGRVFIAAAELSSELGPNGRPKAVPGSLKLLMFDPAPAVRAQAGGPR